MSQNHHQRNIRRNDFTNHPASRFFCKLIDFLKRPIVFAILLTLVYFILNLILIIHHEQWRDEANPWQIAQNIGFDDFYEIMKVEPHPALWYLILFPFAKLGFPYITTNIISLIVMTLSVFLLSYFAPISRKSKILIILSSAFFYFNPVISRNYCLVILSLVLIAMTYRNRLTHPFRFLLSIALLMQSHFLAYGMAAILLLFFVFDLIKQKILRKRIVSLLLGAAIVCISFLSSIPMIIGSLQYHSIINEPSASYLGLGQISEDLNFSLFGTTFPIFEISFAILLLFLLVRSRRIFIYLVAPVIFLLITLSSVYSTGLLSAQKCSLIIAFIIFTFWIYAYEKETRISPKNFFARHLEIVKLINIAPISCVFIIPIVASIPRTVVAAFYDQANDYSYSYEVANFINQNTPAGSVFVVGDSTSAGIAVTFVPLLEDDRKIYDVATESFIDYYQYDGYPELSSTQIAQNISDLSVNYDVYYFASPKSSCNGTDYGPLEIENLDLLKTFDAHPDAYENTLNLYDTTKLVSDVINGISLAEIDDIFSVKSIPRFDVFIENFDTTYGVWNDGMVLEVSDRVFPEYNEYGAMEGEIRTRGNTTYEAGQKYGPYQYKIKLDEAVDLLGMGEHRKWVLLANFLDRSYLRQFYLSGVGQIIMGSQYFSPQMKYIELYINGEYQGLYLLAESIEEDENRLDIESDISEYQTEIPFLVQMENGRIPRTQGDWYDHDTFFMIDDQATPCLDYEWLNGAETTDTLISLEYPESSKDMTAEQYEFLKTEVSDLYSNSRNHINYQELGIDSDSFVNYFAFQDLMFNTGFGSSSVYFYRPLGGEITAGPLWDFDQLLMIDVGHGFTQPVSCDNNLYRYLLRYDEFREALKTRLQWIDEVLNPIISQKLSELQQNTVLREAIMRNEEKYHTWGTYYSDLSVYQNPQIVSYKTWDEHVEHLRQALFTGYANEYGEPISRARWMFENFDSLT